MIDVEATWAQVAKAIAVRSKQDPERFAADMYVEMLKFSSFLLIRAQFILGLRVAQYGQMLQTKGHLDFAADIYEKHLPRLVGLQGHVAELLQGQAATARAWQLARRGKIKNDRAERSAPPEACKPRSKGKATNGKLSPTHANGHAPRARANGKPVNRLDGLFDGLGLGGQSEVPDDD